MKRSICLSLIFLMCAATFIGCGEADTQNMVPEATETAAGTTAATTTEATTEPQIQWETKTVYLCVSRTMTQHDGSGSGTFEYEYDEYGNQIREWYAVYRGDISGRHTEYTYDEKGNMLSSQSVDDQGNPGCRYAYSYNTEGKLLSELYYDAEGVVGAETYYTYNEAGWLIHQTENMYFYDPPRYWEHEITYSDDYSAAIVQSTNNGQQDGYAKETYDTEGRLIRRDSYGQNDSWKTAITYAYDAQGRVLREEHYSSNELQADYDVIYTYDEKDCLISMDVDYYYGYVMEYEYAPFEILVPTES